jgi:hypothetical protein
MLRDLGIKLQNVELPTVYSLVILQNRVYVTRVLLLILEWFVILQSATDDDTDIEDDEEEVEPSKKRRIETPEEASTVSFGIAW